MDDIVVTLDNNPALVKKIEKIEEDFSKLERENHKLKIEVEVLERLLERLSDGKNY